MEIGRPIGAYCFVPGIWFGQLTPGAAPDVRQLEEIVAERVIPKVGRVTIWREAIVWFDFTGTSLEATVPTGRPGPDVEDAVALLSQRALYMTAHSTCIAKALRERKQQTFVAGTVVTSSRQIVSGGGLPPNATDRLLRQFCIIRWQYGKTVPFWETYPRAETTRFVLEEIDAARSLELFEALVQLKEPIIPLDLIVRAEESLQEHDFVEALVLAWTVIEMAIDRLWWNMVDSQLPSGVANTVPRRKRLSDSRTYTAAVRVEMLNFSGFINEDLYGRISSLRKTRNDFLHSGRSIGPTAAMLAVSTAGDMLRIGFGYDTPVNPSWGLHG